MNPSENHNLFDKFIKSFLFQAAQLSNNVSPIDIDLLDYDDIEVRREWKNIDILLYSKKRSFVCAIENKIDSQEGHNQLLKYQNIIFDEFSECNKKIFIYLTIDGTIPSETEHWVSSSYEQIYNILKNILSEFKNNIGEDVHTAINHYSELINRHFMSNNEIVDICRKLYKEHKQALDLIYSHRPDDQLEIKNHLINLLQNEKLTQLGIEHDYSIKTNIRVAVSEWDKYSIQKSGKGQWTESNRVLMFEIQNTQNGIDLKFFIGPGNDDFRKNIYEFSKENSSMFNIKSKNLSAKWNQIYKKQLLSKSFLESELEDIFDELDKKLILFFNSERFNQILNSIEKEISKFV